mmetsp:Transcript_60112/g.71497  ORF Transcript_60112/g.71497 Transcript_60112/m.71497 type:complete len:118 (+) Transcript_60112:166-519(+)
MDKQNTDNSESASNKEVITKATKQRAKSSDVNDFAYPPGDIQDKIEMKTISKETTGGNSKEESYGTNQLSPAKSHNTNEKAKMPKDIENSISNDNKYYHKRHSIAGTEMGTTPVLTL